VRGANQSTHGKKEKEGRGRGKGKGKGKEKSHLTEAGNSIRRVNKSTGSEMNEPV